MDHGLIRDVAICIAAAWVLAVGAHWLKQPLILALSSTVIIVKILYEKQELDTLAGRLTLGIRPLR